MLELELNHLLKCLAIKVFLLLNNPYSMRCLKAFTSIIYANTLKRFFFYIKASRSKSILELSLKLAWRASISSGIEAHSLSCITGDWGAEGR